MCDLYGIWMTVCQVDLKQAFNSVQSLKNELVASVKLDSGLSIYALSPQLRAELTLRFSTVTS